MVLACRCYNLRRPGTFFGVDCNLCALCFPCSGVFLSFWYRENNSISLHKLALTLNTFVQHPVGKLYPLVRFFSVLKIQKRICIDKAQSSFPTLLCLEIDVFLSCPSPERDFSSSNEFVQFNLVGWPPSRRI